MCEGSTLSCEHLQCPFMSCKGVGYLGYLLPPYFEPFFGSVGLWKLRRRDSIHELGVDIDTRFQKVKKIPIVIALP